MNNYSRIFLNSIIFLIALICYNKVFDIVGYMYLVDFNSDNFRYITFISFIGLIALTCASMTKDILLSNIFDIIILSIYLPISIVASKIDGYEILIVIPIISIICIIYSAKLFSKKIYWAITISRGNRINLNKIRYSIFMVFIALNSYYINLNLNLFSFNMLNTYLNTYDIRASGEDSGYLNYFIGWFPLVFFPLFYSVKIRNLGWLMILITFFMGFFVFQVEARKLIILNSVLILGFSFSYKYKKSEFWKYTPQIFFLGIFVISMLIGNFAYPILDRFFYLIGLNSLFYFDYFSSHDLYYFLNTKLDFGVSTYSKGLGFLIDDNYYTGGGTNQSAGFLPTAYANLGIFGVIATSAFLGIIFALLSTLKSVDEKYAFLVIVALAFSLANHDFNMLFLSNGLILIIMLPFVVSRNSP